MIFVASCRKTYASSDRKSMDFAWDSEYSRTCGGIWNLLAMNDKTRFDLFERWCLQHIESQSGLVYF
jgi:hypothetical protein